MWVGIKYHRYNVIVPLVGRSLEAVACQSVQPTASTLPDPHMELAARAVGMARCALGLHVTVMAVDCNKRL